MAFSLLWLPGVLRTAGLKVAVEPGWENRGRGDVGRIFGVICHHTVGAKTGNFPSLRVIRDGRRATATQSALPGPLAQLGLGRDGTYYVIAAGRCNHAGAGSWQGVTTGNTNFIGIEAENAGSLEDFPWPAVQMDAYHRGVAAILKHIGRGPDFCAAHKEYAPLRKPLDPRFNMTEFRAAVAAIMSGSAPAPVLIPAAEPGGGRPTLRRGSTGERVQEVQRKVAVTPDGEFGPKTEAAVRVFQRARGLVPDGIVGPRTWVALDTVA